MVSNASRFQRFFPLTLRQNKTVSDSLAFIQRKQQEQNTKKEFTFVLREKVGTKPIGLLILKDIDWEIKIGELAYCIDQGFEGLGLMTTAVQLFSEYASSTWGFQTLKIIVHHTNQGSIRVAEKSGYSWQKVLPEAYTPTAEKPLDMELYERYFVT